MIRGKHRVVGRRGPDAPAAFAALAAWAFMILAIPGPAAAAGGDEGMWPVSEIGKLGLRAKGLEIPPEAIYSPQGSSLIYGIVQLGATGSFVSADGLIITNHHVAFGAAQAASTTEHDYIRNGFLARTRDREIEAKGMTARITESFSDVSGEVLGAVKPGLDPAARTRAVERKIKAIVARAEKANPGKRAEVAEMFAGKTYLLFLYTHLKDIRLVYVPPRSIGEFGGEEDNWMWPRHTGDFSFLRAYVAPDGSPAEYDPRNVPYHPKVVLKVAPEGGRENDFVFLLGYPGRTYRHSSASFLAYEEDVRMPYVADWYARQIDLMESLGAEDPAVALKLSARIKGLANTMKNYRGKLKGMKRAGIVERKREEERALGRYIESDPGRKARYGDLIGTFDSVYAEIRDNAPYSLVLNSLRANVGLLNLASVVYEASIERPKKDLEREAPFMDRNFPQTRRRLEMSLANFHEPLDRAVLEQALGRAAALPEGRRIAALEKVFADGVSEEDIRLYVDRLYGGSKLADRGFLAEALAKSTGELEGLGDPFLDLAAALYPELKAQSRRSDDWNGRLDELYGRLLDVKAEFKAGDFTPDANGTLRMTFGRIKGYSPADAVYYRPFTTLDGVLEKTTGRAPFDTPEKLFELRRAEDFGRFRPQGFASVPACILYDADTTGGNSGSPVLNARGELVAVNFDRTYEATINDYAWSPDFSRSIGVDIRYVLWVTEKFAGAGFLLEEMGVR